jgi:hypothetical protein
MTTFEEREKAFEAKYRHDQETQFKVSVRRNKLLGRWAAERLGLAGEEAEAYAKAVIAADFAKPGDVDVIEKVLEDFAASGVEMSEHRLRKEMDRLHVLAKEQIRTEAKPPTPESL